MEQQGDPLSEDKTEKLGDFMRRVKDDTVLNLYFVTETGSKRIPTPLFGNPTAEQLRDNRYLQSQVVASRKHYCNEVISSGWTIHVDTKFDQAAFEKALLNQL